MSAEEKRICRTCGTALGPHDEFCPVCAFRGALKSDETATEPSDPEPEASRFGHYEILRREDGSLFELGRGAMGITCPSAPTVIHTTELHPLVVTGIALDKVAVAHPTREYPASALQFHIDGHGEGAKRRNRGSQHLSGRADNRAYFQRMDPSVLEV